ncbi:hypothetical protein BUALT_Bualt02G0096200 [Buddleja alternifolia]|uniref:Pentatricopeptide repeat-containing protein n=1 Tax=Buddleja alternifolia TaxID=168488 RepID=A0AAV6Y556_9LAMI|nr:hypothetical protein BUALT_Bualt02G0096200 [Buddleja alternifolia]
MKPQLRLFRPKPSLNLSSAIRGFTITTNSSISAAAAAAAALTEEEVTQINAVVPRLCSSNRLKDAVNLISAALFTANPPLNSLPLSDLVNRLAQEPDLTHPMHFLNALKYSTETLNPILIQIVEMFVSSFFRNGDPKKALKIFQWLSRPDFPGGVAKDSEIYAVFVDGFCKNGMILDSVRVLRVMASENVVVGSEVRVCVYRGLLREARVREALELNAALDRCNLGNGSGDSCSKEVVELLDRMIANWIE